MILTPDEINTIYRRLKSLSYIRVGGTMQATITDPTPVGWNAHASSILRKAYAFERLKDYIGTMELPLEIKDPYPNQTPFQIFIKQ